MFLQVLCTFAHFLFYRRKILTHYLSKLLYIFVLLIFSSCAPSTVNRAENQGAAPLNNQEIFKLSSGNTLRLISSDFDSYIYFNQDGSLSARSVFNDNTDFGTWDITSDGKLCIKFNIWYYGDINCYSTYKDSESDQYLLFTSNGALAYTAKASSGNSQGIAVKNKKDKKTVYVRDSLSQEQTTSPSDEPAVSQSVPEAAAVSAPVTTNRDSNVSQEEVKQSVKTMAQNCPNCNFENADLRKAYLVGANLKGANLKGADLSRANLRRANLEGADLSGATLLSTNLPGANLRKADLSGADFSGSNLIQVDFTGADTQDCIFENTLQEGVKGLK